jgi:hypothetical protein
MGSDFLLSFRHRTGNKKAILEKQSSDPLDMGPPGMEVGVGLQFPHK